MVDHRVQLGDEFRLSSFSSVAVEMRARVLVEFDNGRFRPFDTKLTTTADRLASATSFGNMEANGKVVRAIVARITPRASRGQTYVTLTVRDRNLASVDILLRDYLYELNNPTFPNIIPSGPGGGNGFISKRVVADDIAPADIQESLASTNALRRIDGFIWYYHCSGDVADRTLRASLRDLGDGLPTGMTSGGNTLAQLWPSAGVLTLSANQEGLMIVSAQMGNSFAVTADNGARTIEDVSVAQPLPFPYWAGENDVGEFFFDVTDEEAADRHSIYIIQEEWIEV